MALTIRNIDAESRKLLDDFKTYHGIKADSKAFIKALHDRADYYFQLERLTDENEKLQAQLKQYKRIFAGLEFYLDDALTLIKRQELEMEDNHE